MYFQAYLRRECGIQSTPRDKVAVEKQTRKYTPGYARIGGGVVQGGCAIRRIARYVVTCGDGADDDDDDDGSGVENNLTLLGASEP